MRKVVVYLNCSYHWMLLLLWIIRLLELLGFITSDIHYSISTANNFTTLELNIFYAFNSPTNVTNVCGYVLCWRGWHIWQQSLTVEGHPTISIQHCYECDTAVHHFWILGGKIILLSSSTVLRLKSFAYKMYLWHIFCSHKIDTTCHTHQ